MKAIICSLLVILFIRISGTTIAQQDPLYDPDKDAIKQLDEAVRDAKAENKHVLVQVGGNWCPWCIKLHAYMNEHSELDSIINADYIPVKINYSKENKNKAALERLEHPQRFGFPVLIVLDADGSRIHTQDSGYLESGKGYDYEKVKRFLVSWNKKAIEP